jgi:hypothetical protein
MVWFAVFAGVAAVWAIVLALLARQLWRKTKALAGELSSAQAKLQAIQTAPAAEDRSEPAAPRA